MNNGTLSSGYNYQPSDPSRRIKGIVIVIAIHALVFWFIASGLGRKALNLVKKPLEAVVIQEVIIPPPPPPPPPKEIVKTPETTQPKIPDPYVPPPEVAPPVTSTAPVIQSTQTVPVAPPVIAPPPPVEAPVAPKAHRGDIGVACPNQVPPEMPAKAIDDGITGVVKAQARIVDGVVKEVTILSGPRVFHSAVKRAMMQYKCVNDGQGEVLASQEFNFKLDE